MCVAPIGLKLFAAWLGRKTLEAIKIIVLSEFREKPIKSMEFRYQTEVCLVCLYGVYFADNI